MDGKNTKLYDIQNKLKNTIKNREPQLRQSLNDDIDNSARQGNDFGQPQVKVDSGAEHSGDLGWRRAMIC